MDITNIIVAVVMVVLGYLVSKAVESYQKWQVAENSTEDWLKSFIGAVCEVAERTYVGKGRGKEKLAYLIGIVEVECEKRGVSFDKELIIRLVDEYVLTVLNISEI